MIGAGSFNQKVLKFKYSFVVQTIGYTEDCIYNKVKKPIFSVETNTPSAPLKGQIKCFNNSRIIHREVFEDGASIIKVK